jgi:hypothetical protein
MSKRIARYLSERLLPVAFCVGEYIRAAANDLL